MAVAARAGRMHQTGGSSPKRAPAPRPSPRPAPRRAPAPRPSPRPAPRRQPNHRPGPRPSSPPQRRNLPGGPQKPEAPSRGPRGLPIPRINPVWAAFRTLNWLNQHLDERYRPQPAHMIAFGPAAEYGYCYSYQQAFGTPDCGYRNGYMQIGTTAPFDCNTWHYWGQVPSGIYTGQPISVPSYGGMFSIGPLTGGFFACERMAMEHIWSWGNSAGARPNTWFIPYPATLPIFRPAPRPAPEMDPLRYPSVQPARSPRPAPNPRPRPRPGTPARPRPGESPALHPGRGLRLYETGALQMSVGRNGAVDRSAVPVAHPQTRPPSNTREKKLRFADAPGMGLVGVILSAHGEAKEILDAIAASMPESYRAEYAKARTIQDKAAFVWRNLRHANALDSLWNMGINKIEDYAIGGANQLASRITRQRGWVSPRGPSLTRIGGGLPRVR